jgi:oligoendopeptidase F
MPITITDDNGEAKEVFTVEELQEQKDAAIEEFKAANPDKSEEVTKLQDELEKLKGKDMNFANLRAQKEAAETKLADVLKGVDDKISTVKKDVLDGVMQDHYQDTLKALVGNDKELAAKVELQYKRLADVATTKAEVAKKLNDAYVLATGVVSSALDTGAFGSGGAGPIKIDNTVQGQKLTPEEKGLAIELARKGGMNLTEKDLEGK